MWIDIWHHTGGNGRSDAEGGILTQLHLILSEACAASNLRSECALGTSRLALDRRAVLGTEARLHWFGAANDGCWKWLAQLSQRRESTLRGLDVAKPEES